MANPLKVLTALSASAGAVVSGSDGLKVKQGGLAVEAGNLAVTGTIAATQGITLSGTLDFTQDSQITSVALSSGDGGASATLRIIPDKDLIVNHQYIVVDPTSPSHIHLRAGGDIDASNADLFLGGEKANVQVTDGATHNVMIHSSGTTTHEWIFGNDGILTQDGSALALESWVTDGFVAKDGSGNVIIDGNLTVKGTPTQIESNVVNIGDINLNLGTGSANLSLIDGGGLSLGSGSLVTLNYVSASDAWTSNKNLDLGETGVYKLQGTTVLSGTSLTNINNAPDLYNIGTNGGDAVTIYTYSDPDYTSSYAQFNVAAGIDIFANGWMYLNANSGVDIGNYTSGSDGTNAQINIANDNTNGAAKTVNIGIDGYSILNLAGTTTLSGTLSISSSAGGVVLDVAKEINDVKSLVSGVTIVHAERYTSLRIVLTASVGSPTEDVDFTLSAAGDGAVHGLVASTAAALSDKLAGASFDVAVRVDGSTTWTNDLVSLYVAPVSASEGYVPKATISAPALEANSIVRLIVVNETSGSIL